MKISKTNILLASIIIIMSILYLKSCESNSFKSELIISLNDTLSITKDEKGRQKAQIGVLKFEKEKDLLEIRTKDSSIIKLQDIVKDYKGKLKAAIILGNSTSDFGSSETIVILDTLHLKQFPTYKTSWNEKWSKGTIIANKDSIHRNISFKNEFEITLGNVRNKLFRKKEFDVIVKNNNQNTYTEELRAFSVSPKSKKFNLALQIGYGINSNLMLTPYLGFGLSYIVLGIK